MAVVCFLGKVAVLPWGIGFSLLAEHHTELCGTVTGVVLKAESWHEKPLSA